MQQGPTHAAVFQARLLRMLGKALADQHWVLAWVGDRGPFAAHSACWRDWCAANR